jgi:hypothetical protein
MYPLWPFAAQSVRGREIAAGIPVPDRRCKAVVGGVMTISG